jgi:hypothetical protein
MAEASMSSSLDDLRQYCESACIKLWGEPHKRTTKGLRWNGGDAYSAKTFSRSKRAWYDHDAKRGGSTLELVDYHKGRPQRDLHGSVVFDVWREANAMGIVPEPAPEPKPKPNGKGGRWPIRATYPYHDEQGTLLYEQVRFDTEVRDNRFRPRRPDGQDGWIWDLKGVRRVLYRLPELIEGIASGYLVLVCEGEGDVEAAVRLGYIATTNPEGINKWHDEFDEFFGDADVVVVSDNDPQLKDQQTGEPQFHPDGRPRLPGQDHAAQVAQRLARVAKRVRKIMFDVKDLRDWFAAGHSREELDRLIEQAPDWTPEPAGQVEAPPQDAKPLPELIISSSNPTAAAKDLATLIARRDDFLFNGYAPVRIAAEAGYLPRALEVTTEMVRVLAHEICVPIKVRSKNGVTERIPVPLSKDIAQLYLQGLEGSWGLEPFHGIVTAPLLSDDGKIRIARGYDAVSGLWCHDIPDVHVPEQPTRQDAERALRLLRQFFRTFPFADAARRDDPNLGIEVIDLSKPIGLDESSFLAALLTAVCRQSLDLAPGFLCDAPNFSGAGTGKGLLVKAICIVGSGVKPSAFTSGHDAEELDKRLTAALIEARPAVFLDNFNNKNLTSDILASVLTESPAMVRPMGHSKTVPLHTRCFIGITGNSVQIAEDMARRLLKVHLDAHMEDPEQRPFAAGFLDQVFTERTELLSWALTIWKWGRLTKLKPGKPLGSFEVWAQWCRDPLLALGLCDPVDRLAEIKAADPKRKELISIFEQWWSIHGEALLKGHELDYQVIKLIQGATRDGVIIRQKVAAFLGTHEGTRVGGYVLSRTMLGPPSKEVAHYKLARKPKEPTS